MMNDSKARLLIVDDDAKLRSLLGKYLSDQGFLIKSVGGAEQARHALAQASFDLIVLDVMMPGESGVQFAQKIRQDSARKTLPILMLTALGDVEHRIEGLESGADDYLPKPFEPRELVLRISKLLDRSRSSSAVEPKKEVFSFGGLTYRLDLRVLKTATQEVIHLTSVESDLLHVFATHPREALSRFDLAERAGVTLSPRTVDVQITRLRKKLEDDPKKPQYLRTVRHKGYALWPD
jgi:two-component system phosphate regulon response regulator OmpR